MDRRNSLKTILIGSALGGLAATGCKTPEETIQETGVYGRTIQESERDLKLLADEYLLNPELEDIAILCDIILPASSDAPSAVDVDVPEFIEFIVKDIPKHQLKLRGGLAWLNSVCVYRFAKVFRECPDKERLVIIEEIAYPNKAKPEMEYGVKFFNLMRDLTLTGYYTTQAGIKDLGYLGNRPNAWDGVPQDVLQKHNMQYDEEWLAKCVDQNTRNDIAQWDDEGNLLN